MRGIASENKLMIEIGSFVVPGILRPPHACTSGLIARYVATGIRRAEMGDRLGARHNSVERHQTADYRAYILASDGRIAKAIELDCPDDEAAKEAADEVDQIFREILPDAAKKTLRTSLAR